MADSGEVFNIGSSSEIAIGALFELIAATMGVAGATARSDEQRLRPAGSEVHRLFCDNRKLVHATGFSPQVALEEGLRATIGWFRDPRNLARYKTRTLQCLGEPSFLPADGERDFARTRLCCPSR